MDEDSSGERTFFRQAGTHRSERAGRGFASRGGNPAVVVPVLAGERTGHRELDPSRSQAPTISFKLPLLPPRRLPPQRGVFYGLIPSSLSSPAFGRPSPSPA